MTSIGDVFNQLNLAKSSGVVVDYAVGGAMAVLFYAEPARTYDLDVFVLLEEQAEGSLALLAGIYA